MKKNKKYYIIPDNKLYLFINELILEHGLPQVNSILNIYFVKNREYLYRIFFKNSDIYFQKNNNELNKKFFSFFDNTKIIKLKNKNIKLFLDMILNFGLKKAFVGGEIIEIEFENGINFKLNTPVGNICDFPIEKKQKYNNFLKNTIDKIRITKQFFKQQQTEFIFDKLGNLNEKIINYGDKFGIDFSQLNSQTINSKLKMKSNDYSSYEKLFSKLFNQELNPKLNTEKRNKGIFKPLSIIIPSYNSEESLIKVLYSIESQNIYKKDKELLDVIIIDDGSAVPVKTLIRDSGIEKEISFDLRIFRNETNQGLSTARNIGINLSKEKYLLFLDSDILLSKSYLLEHSILLQLFPHAIFFSLKKNIEKNSNIIAYDKIKQGLNLPKFFDDKRIVRSFNKNQLWINSIPLDGDVGVLSETQNLKKIGFGRIVNGYDLPSVVVGHNFSVCKNAIKNNLFSTEFKVWGLEDTLFGAKFIAEGGFIMPALNTGVYHIDHLPRSGSAEKQRLEYQKNLKIYKEIINKEEYE
jgi:glycosyltransferase involved in cell wall biosynthesis